jgi:hypothetical protein
VPTKEMESGATAVSAAFVDAFALIAT